MFVVLAVIVLFCPVCMAAWIYGGMGVWRGVELFLLLAAAPPVVLAVTLFTRGIAFRSTRPAVRAASASAGLQ